MGGSWLLSPRLRQKGALLLLLFGVANFSVQGPITANALAGSSDPSTVAAGRQTTNAGNDVPEGLESFSREVSPIRPSVLTSMYQDRSSGHNRAIGGIPTASALKASTVRIWPIKPSRTAAFVSLTISGRELASLYRPTEFGQQERAFENATSITSETDF